MTRLVNCKVLAERTNPWGTTALFHWSGADGRPERALAMARTMAGHTAANEHHNIRIVGITITDVNTGEIWTVTL